VNITVSQLRGNCVCLTWDGGDAMIAKIGAEQWFIQISPVDQSRWSGVARGRLDALRVFRDRLEATTGEQFPGWGECSGVIWALADVDKAFDASFWGEARKTSLYDSRGREDPRIYEWVSKELEPLFRTLVSEGVSPRELGYCLVSHVTSIVSEMSLRAAVDRRRRETVEGLREGG
jgi:hypothetical protein